VEIVVVYQRQLVIDVVVLRCIDKRLVQFFYRLIVQPRARITAGCLDYVFGAHLLFPVLQVRVFIVVVKPRKETRNTARSNP